MAVIPSITAFLEKRIARSKVLVTLYAEFYREVVEREIELAGIGEEDRVLNIGCGAIPFTAILIARLTGARVWAVDCDLAAVKTARFCVAAQGLKDLITVVHLDGRAEIPFPFDLALVALQARPKREILTNLFRCGGPGVRLVFRSARSSMAHQYDLLPRDIKYSDFVMQDKTTFDLSVLYTGRQEQALTG